jgi:TonB family protein
MSSFSSLSLSSLSPRALRAHPARMLIPAVVLSLAAGSAFAGGTGESGARNAPAGSSTSPTCAVPEFPARWQDEGDTGIVTLAVLVGEDGKVMASRLVNSSGIARVDRASLRASAKCKFQPAAKDSPSAPAWTRVQYNWVVE